MRCDSCSQEVQDIEKEVMMALEEGARLGLNSPLDTAGSPGSTAAESGAAYPYADVRTSQVQYSALQAVPL
jgi:hypothetical protein